MRKRKQKFKWDKWIEKGRSRVAKGNKSKTDKENTNGEIQSKKKAGFWLKASAAAGIISVYLGTGAFLAGGMDQWMWMGMPFPALFFPYVLDSYPGHGAKCYQYKRIADALPKPNSECPMTAERPLEIMEGKLCFAGISLRIGDTREQVRHKLRYGKWKEEKEECFIGCIFCWTGFYLLDFVYDEQDHLERILIEYWEDY